jgi:serine/threonine protein kinase
VGQGAVAPAEGRAEGPLPRGEAVRLFRNLLQVLEALHACALVHRDVKSQNILLAEDGTLKSADFGPARNLSLPGSLTRRGAVLGTVGYMAPEVARGKEATPLSDLYSVGCVLLEMLTGELFYEGHSLDSIWRQAVEAPRLHLLKKRGVPGGSGRSRRVRWRRIPPTGTPPPRPPSRRWTPAGRESTSRAATAGGGPWRGRWSPPERSSRKRGRFSRQNSSGRKTGSFSSPPGGSPSSPPACGWKTSFEEWPTA